MVGSKVGSYRISGELGSGGMGKVYLAEHMVLGRKAAIKLLRPELTQSDEAVQRFFNEARAATAIRHPGIVEVFDVGTHDDGRAFIVMEFLEGEVLGDRIEHLGRLAPERAVHVTRQVLSALAAAHHKGIVHRDLKPDNIYVVQDPDVTGGERIKILDFGIAKLAEEAKRPGSYRTQTGMVMGTPAYMAPEQCRGSGDVDWRADLYSVGCILYHMVCGAPPFDGRGAGEVIGKHMYEPPPPPRSLAADIPAPLERVILRLLAKSPEERHQSAGEAIAELAELGLATSTLPSAAANLTPPPTPAKHLFQGGAPASQPLARDEAKGVKLTTLSSASRVSIATTSSRRPRTVLFGGLALTAAAVAGALLVIFVLGGGEGEPAVQAAIEPAATEPAAAEPAVADPVPPEPDGRATVAFTILSTPPGAEVYRKLDARRVGTTPFDDELLAGDGELVFVLKLAGHKDAEVAVNAREGGEHTVELAALEKPPPTRAERRKGADRRPGERRVRPRSDPDIDDDDINPFRR